MPEGTGVRAVFDEVCAAAGISGGHRPAGERPRHGRRSGSSRPWHRHPLRIHGGGRFRPARGARHRRRRHAGGAALVWTSVQTPASGPAAPSADGLYRRGHCAHPWLTGRHYPSDIDWRRGRRIKGVARFSPPPWRGAFEEAWTSAPRVPRGGRRRHRWGRHCGAGAQPDLSFRSRSNFGHLHGPRRNQRTGAAPGAAKPRVFDLLHLRTPLHCTSALLFYPVDRVFFALFDPVWAGMYELAPRLGGSGPRPVMSIWVARWVRSATCCMSPGCHVAPQQVIEPHRRAAGALFDCATNGTGCGRWPSCAPQAGQHP